MSFTEGHVLICDCDSCLNRGGGTPARAPTVAATPPDRPPSWRLRAKKPRGAIELAKLRARDAAKAAQAAADYVTKLEAIGENQ